MKYPRLYVNGVFKRIVHPIDLSITQNIIPLDTASITLPIGEELPARSYVELFTPYGSAGMFRVRSPHDAYGQETTTAELEHMISEVGDYVVKDEISEMLPANSAMQRIFSHYGGNKWQLGSVSALGSDLIACEANHDRVLDNMLAILEQKPDCMMAFDFTTSPWTVKIVKKGETVTAEGRLARNVTSAVIGYDDTELCTRVWYKTFNGTTGTWTYKDADTKLTYGIVEGTVRTSSDMTADEINATVNAYITDHKKPRISVNIQADELSQITGESIDKFTVGKLMRLNLVEYGVTTEEVITSVIWNDVYGNPRQVTVNLGAEEDTVVTFLHNLDAKGGGGGGGGHAKDKQDEEFKEFDVRWEKLDDRVEGNVARLNRDGTILEQAGLTLNSQGVLIYAETSNGLKHQFDVLNNLFVSKISDSEKKTESKITQTASNINLRVTDVENDLQSRININSNRITAQSKEIALKADLITLDGYVKATDLTTEYFKTKIAGISLLSVQTLAANKITSTSVYGNKVEGADVVVGSVSLKNAIVSASVSDNVLTLRNAKGGTVTFSKATSLSGVWGSNGVFTVTADPQGETISTTVSYGTGSRSGATVSIPIRGTQNGSYVNVGRNALYTLTSHSSCVSGLSVYSTSSIQLYYKYDETTYRSAGSHIWYYKNSYTAPTTYYD